MKISIKDDRKEEASEEELEEAKDLLKEGLAKIFKATRKISKEIIQAFKEISTEEEEREAVCPVPAALASAIWLNSYKILRFEALPFAIRNLKSIS